MNSRLIVFWAVMALCAGILPTAPAQTAAPKPTGRFLLVFDTSSAMRKRVSSEQDAVERLFFSMMNGQLHTGDTIGLWTFDRTLHAGKFPLQHWQPQNAASIASLITNFLARQHYSRSTRFGAVMPDIDNLVRLSERLTVLIFCDGDDQINGTPFDKSINSIFKKNRRALKKAGRVFVVVLRSQFGQYIGYAVSSSEVGVGFPPFPALPAAAAPAAIAKTNIPALKTPPPTPAPVIQLPPLVIVGTNVGTNLIPAATPPPNPTSKPANQTQSNPPAGQVKASPEVRWTPAPIPNNLTGPTNAISAKRSEAETNGALAAPTPQNPTGLSRNGAMAIGAALLVAAMGLIIAGLMRSRKSKRSSLISSAMKKK